MNKEELDIKIRFLIGNYRNLVYYCSIDLSERSTYIHQVRKFRKKAVDLLSSMPDLDTYDASRKLFTRIINSCNPKIKTVECPGWILGTLNNILEEEGFNG